MMWERATHDVGKIHRKCGKEPHMMRERPPQMWAIPHTHGVRKAPPQMWEDPHTDVGNTPHVWRGNDNTQMWELTKCFLRSKDAMGERVNHSRSRLRQFSG